MLDNKLCIRPFTKKNTTVFVYLHVVMYYNLLLYLYILLNSMTTCSSCEVLLM